MQRKPIRRASIMVMTTACLVGCASPGLQQQRTAAADDCNVAGSAAVGALAAFALNAMVGDGRNNVRAAALGAAAGAGLCMLVKSQQVKTAEQADAEYRKRVGALPPEPKVVSYSSITSSPTVRRGEKFQVNSNFELVNGSRTRVSDVREELTLLGPDGRTLQSGSKPVAVNSDQVKTAGAYSNSFTLTVPAAVPEGNYTVQTKLYVNGNEIARNAKPMQMVWVESPTTKVASR